MSFRHLTPVLVTTLVTTLLSITTPLASFGQAVTSFEDIDFWVGSGSSSAALAIDWNGDSSSDESYVWGYRWEGSTNGAEMLVEVISADERFYAKLGEVAGLGTAVVGLGYDQNDDGQFELTENTFFDDRGINISSLSDGENSADSEDFYAEGWFLGFWHLGFAAENPLDGDDWLSTSTGIDKVTLTNNSWVSLAFTTDTFSTSAFAENLVAAESSFSADFDEDNDVDGADFLTWQLGFGITSGSSLEQGDANGDGAIDELDLHFWTSTFGNTTYVHVAQVVPEPSSTTLALASLFSFLGTRFCNRCRILRSSF